MARKIVTIAPPTPNGDLHLGHISGPYMAADVYARVRRLRGDDVVLLCYADDYQSYLARKARELNVERFALGRENGTKIAETLRMIDIELDWFHQAGHNDYFRRAVTQFYTAARDSGNVVSKASRIPYFPAFDMYGYEAFGRGDCNHCGASSDASQCEDCAHAPDVTKMENIRCTLGPSEVEWRTVEREYLRLDAFRGFLRSLYETKALRPHLRAYLEEVLALPDLDWAVTRPHEYGIELDEPGQPNVHTWFSGIAGYFATFCEWADRQGKPELIDAWLKDRDTGLVHFLGFDCSFSHAIAYPVLLSLVDGFQRDVQIYTNRFLKLEGEDFSTSRGHAIWVRDILKTHPADAVRTYLALNSPEEAVCNFSMAEFSAWYETAFNGKLNRLRDTLFNANQKQAFIAIAACDRAAFNTLLRDWRHAGSEGAFSMRRLARVCASVLDLAADAAVHRAADARMLLAAYAVLSSPIHPAWSSALMQRIGLEQSVAAEWLDAALAAASSEPLVLEAA
ncbi:methionine--tRNA ligase [Noviherbaspirillum denitrificans]|uniref:Methionyl/Leucyl tRNA synthetase domain-containing protein n=1 Tax=Noviherbaspirillum denitrificans TaxID=1968433 RepID=A0A254THC6_9BURK|nr:methionine--tRNA ligase [Noviherbaspirillum denitrificans]OWW21577.1 hypothetical protein AYR66_20895 [Noviherbaspirillum denitrificans]